MFSDPLIKHIVIAAIIIACSAILGRLFKSLLNVVFNKVVSRTKTSLDNRVIDLVRAKMLILSIILGVHLGIREVRKGLTAEFVTYHEILDYLSLILFIILVLTLAHLISRLLKAVVEWYGDEVSVKTQSDVTTAITPIATKLINILLFLIVSLVVLDHVGVNIGGLLVSLGVGSLALALAAQETLANMIGWFVIVVDQPFRLGDVIKLPTGEEGKVFQIGLRATRILNADNNLLIIPNGDIIKTRITNISSPSEITRLIVDFSIALVKDIEKAKSIILKTVQEHEDILHHPAPEILVTNYTDIGITLRLSAQTTLQRKASIESSLREKIYLTFGEQQIETGMPRRTIYIEHNATQTS